MPIPQDIWPWSSRYVQDAIRRASRVRSGAGWSWGRERPSTGSGCGPRFPGLGSRGVPRYGTAYIKVSPITERPLPEMIR